MAPVGGLGPIESIPLMGVGLAGDARPPQAASSAIGGFEGMLAGAVSRLNGQLIQGDRMEELAASGQLSDPTMAIVEVEKADIALQLATQVRNKLVEGWQELARMQV